VKGGRIGRRSRLDKLDFTVLKTYEIQEAGVDLLNPANTAHPAPGGKAADDLLTGRSQVKRDVRIARNVNTDAINEIRAYVLDGAGHPNPFPDIRSNQ
jgi:hypothetical protein